MRIKVPIKGKKSPPIRVMHLVTENFVAITEDLHVEYDENTRLPTGLLNFTDLYGANVSFHHSHLKRSVAMCATHVRQKGNSFFVIHPPSYKNGSPDLTYLVSNEEAEMNKCWIYNNQFGI